jgi:TolB protein
MRIVSRKCGILALVLVLCWVVCPASQERGPIIIDIDQVGGYLLPIALPKFKGETAEPVLGQQIRTVMQHDLERTGLFRILDANGDGVRTIKTLSYGGWSRLGAAGVIAGQLDVSQGPVPLTLQLTLHDVAQQLMLSGKIYHGLLEEHRRMAHRFSDHVIKVFTGEPGPFDTQVMCVRPVPGNKGTEIVRMDYDGHGVQRLVVNGALNLAPVLSPDSSVLAYTSYRAGAPDIYLLNLHDGQEERLTNEPGLALAGSWSPDGRYLALSRTIDGNNDIFLYDTRRRRFKKLTSDPGIDISPSFAPDGHRLVFTSDRGGSPQLYLTNVKGGRPARLTFEGTYNTAPAWSPRDNTIAYVGRGESLTMAIYTIHAESFQRQLLSAGSRQYEAPTWDPHGRFLMHTSRVGDAWQRYMVRQDGYDKIIPAANGLACLSPQWIARAKPSS